MKNKLKKLLSIVAFGSLLNGFGQSPQWLFANTNASPAKALVNGGGFMQTTGFTPSSLGVTNNMITDASGKRLFGVIDNYLYDEVSSAGGEMIYYEVRNWAPYVKSVSPRGFVEKLVLPAPKAEGGIDCNRYFVIHGGNQYDRNWEYQTNPTSNFTSPDSEPYYSIVNMNTNNRDEYLEVLQTKTQGGNTYNCTAKPLMDLVPGLYVNGNANQNIYSPSMFLAATKLRSDNTYFLFVLYNDDIYRFTVATSGITYSGTVASTSPIITTVPYPGEMEVYEKSNGEYKLAVSYYPITGNARIYCAELNINGTLKTSPAPVEIILNYVNNTMPVIHGLEFSPNGNYLYVTHETNSSHLNPIEYCTFGATTLTALSSAPANKVDYAKGQIQWNKDNGNDYLYFASENELSRLTNANNPTSATWAPVVDNTTNGYSNLLGYAWNELSGSPLVGFRSSYLLPTYVDQMDYLSPYQADVCCLEYKANSNIKENITLPVGTYTVSSTSPNNVLTCTITGSSPTQTVSVAFTPTTTVDGNITIPNGAKVTFQNLRMEFSERAALIVNANVTGQQGGKVVLNATTLTAFTTCNPNTMWPGVVLNSSPTVPVPAQGSTSSSPNAVLTTVGVSQIDHALTALNIKGGAIVQYTGGSKLLDNKVAIEAEAYNRNASLDVGYFNNAIIKTQSTFTNVPVVQMSYLVRAVDRIPTLRFQNCTIIDDNSQHKQLYDGVISNNSAVSFTSGTTVSNFRVGISHTNTNVNTVRKITIENCTFNSNLMGVYIGSSNYAVVRLNTFNVVDNTTLIQWPYGLFLDQSSKFLVTNNEFQCVNYPPVISGPSGAGDAGGLWVRNSNINEANINIIRSNTFTKLDNGVVNMDKNYTVVTGSPTTQVGLRYYCNTFTTPITWQDFLINSGTIDYNQGVGDTTARNSFSHDGYFGDMVVNIPATPPSTSVHYFYKGIGTAYDPIINSPSDTYIFDFNLTATDKNTCGAGGGGERLADGTLEPSDYLENINWLKTSISEITGQNNKGDGQDTLGEEEKEELSLWMERLQTNQNALIIHYLNDSLTNDAIDSAAKYIQLFANDEKELFGYYIETSQLKKAASSLDLIREYEPASSKYTEVCEIMYQLADKDLENEMLSNPLLEQQLIQLANDDSDQRSYLIARNILNKINHIYGPYPVNFTAHTSTERRAMEEAKAIKNETYLSNYPNPFTGKTTLTAFVPKGSTSASIVITDLLGKIVAKFDLTEGNNSVEFDKQEAKGILYYSLFIDGARKETKMMMKQ